MITYIEDQDAADRARAELQEARNQVITAHTTAAQEDADEEHWEASKLTQAADKHLETVRHHERLLIEWDEETSREHHCGTDCAQETRQNMAYDLWKDGV